MKRLLTLIINLIILMPVTAYSADENGTASSQALVPPTIGGLETTLSIIKVLAAFLIVAGVMALVFKIMGKIGPSAMGKNSLIEVLDTKMITPKKYISVIRIADQDMAVGISENNIAMLCTLGKTTSQSTTKNHNEFNRILTTATKQEGGNNA